MWIWISIIGGAIYFAGAAMASRWVWNSWRECGVAASNISKENGLPVGVMKVLLPVTAIALWPLLAYAITTVEASRNDS